MTPHFLGFIKIACIPLTCNPEFFPNQISCPLNQCPQMKGSNQIYIPSAVVQISAFLSRVTIP